MQKANERMQILVKKVNKKTASYLLGMFDLTRPSTERERTLSGSISFVL